MNDTIAAISTAPGTGGIAVIRVSGPEAFGIVSGCWTGKNLDECRTHTAHLGRIVGADGEPIDKVVLTLFRAPNSYTGENCVEISCHGSVWIQREIVNRLVRLGARPAEPGEFTQRAFMNGRMDLAQAEGVVDLIAASSRAAHRLAMQQANGSFSRHLESLRSQLVDYASLLELELDFSEEEVEFADRKRLLDLADEIIRVIRGLADSYAAGKAFKEGIPVVIAGAPNAGKSTLLNRLLDEEKAIVSDIPGTTRDIIEDTREIDGILFRFVDTAGLRRTDDTVERIGIERAEERLSRAAVILWLVDASTSSKASAASETGATDSSESIGNIEIESALMEIQEKISSLPSAHHIILLNKSDLTPTTSGSRNIVEKNDSREVIDNNNASFSLGHPDSKTTNDSEFTYINVFPESGIETRRTLPGSGIVTSMIPVISVSAKTGVGIDAVIEKMVEIAKEGANPENDIIVSNARHYALLLKGLEAMERSRDALQLGISADFIAQDVRDALHHLGALTGSITTPDLLATIFSRFCIGK